MSFNRVEAQTAEGAQALYRRLRAAAHDVCAQPYETIGLPSRDLMACKSAALDTAVQSVNVPEVSSLHGFTGTIDVMVSP